MTMDLERLRHRWAELGAGPPNRPIARLATRRWRWWVVLQAGARGLELLFASAASVLLAQRLPEHADDVVAASVVLLTAAATVAWALSSGWRLRLWSALRFEAPVFELRRVVLRLRRAEAWAALAALGAGACLWLPAALLAVEIVGGPPLLASVDRGWLLANLCFGVSVWLCLRLAGRRLVGTGSEPGEREGWLEGLAGGTLARLAAELAELDAATSRFQDAVERPRGNTPDAPR